MKHPILDNSRSFGNFEEWLLPKHSISVTGQMSVWVFPRHGSSAVYGLHTQTSRAPCSMINSHICSKCGIIKWAVSPSRRKQWTEQSVGYGQIEEALRKPKRFTIPVLHLLLSPRAKCPSCSDSFSKEAKTISTAGPCVFPAPAASSPSVLVQNVRKYVLCCWGINTQLSFPRGWCNKLPSVFVLCPCTPQWPAQNHHYFYASLTACLLYFIPGHWKQWYLWWWHSCIPS